MTSDQTPDDEAKARREKVEKMAGQAYDAASEAAKQASQMANKAKAYGQEQLGKVDMDALRKGKLNTVPKPLLFGAPAALLLLLVLLFSGGGGEPYEKAVEQYYDALATGNAAKLEEHMRGFEGMEERLRYHVEESLARFKARDGIKDVTTTCGKPGTLMNGEVLLTTCEVTLKMRDGTELDEGFLRVSRIDGEWKVVF